MRISRSFSRSLWVFHFNTGSCNGCDIEVLATLMPRHDPERFGIKLVGSPRHADVMIVTGPVTWDMKDRLRRVYAQIPEPKVVIGMGSCQSGGVFFDSYNLVGPLDTILPVTMYIPGCPPRPEALIDGVVKAIAHLEEMEGEQ